MKFNLLGSGGASKFPRPTCFCQKCEKARILGIPYYRSGPSLYYYDEGVLFDTAEEAADQLNRERIEKVEHIFYSHWHPDHVQGARIVEHLKQSVTLWDGTVRKTDGAIVVYIPEKDSETFLRQFPVLYYYREKKWLILTLFKDGERFKVGNSVVTPFDFKRPDRFRYGFLIEKNGKRVFYAPCSTFGLRGRKELEGADVFFTEFGWPEKAEEMREKLPADHWWQDHASLADSIALARKLKAKRTVLAHIYGSLHYDFDELKELVAPYQKDLNVEVGYDGMKIEV